MFLETGGVVAMASYAELATCEDSVLDTDGDDGAPPPSL